MSAVRLLEEDDVWTATIGENSEQEDAIIAISTIRRIVSQVGKQEGQAL